MISSTDGELRVVEPDGELLETIPGEDVQSFDFAERVGRRKDTGSVTLGNDYGEYTDTITSGDRLEFLVEIPPPEDERIETWGDSELGEFVWPGDRLVWTAMARSRTLNRESFSSATIQIECEDYALGTMMKRHVFDSFEDVPIYALLKRLISRYAPELNVAVDQSLNLTVETSVTFDGKTLYDCVDELVSRADAVVRTYGDHVYIEPFTVPEPRFTADPREDFDVTNKTIEDDSLVNVVRVVGPEEPILDRDATYERQQAHMTLGPDDSMYFRVPTQKSEIHTIALWTMKRSDGPLRVRLQREDNGQPAAIDEPEQDLARRELSHEFIAEDGWTEFLMPEHDLKEPPIAIIETDNGPHRIGCDWSAEIVRQVYYPYPVSAQTQDTYSIREFGRREDVIHVDNVDSEDARDRALAEVRRRNSADFYVECNAESRRMHMLRPGEFVTFDYPRDGIEGDFMLVERSDAFSGMEIDTTMTFQMVDSL